MAGLANLVRWEWFKLWRRWMPWILLGILLLFSQLFLWASFGSYLNFKGGNARASFISEFGGRPEQMICDEILAGRIPDLPPGADINALVQQCQQLQSQREELLRQRHNDITLPGSLTAMLPVVQNIGMILVAILTASTLGAEHSWGTLRSILARGTARWQYLGAKLVMMALVAAGAIVVVTAGLALSSAAIGALAGAAPGPASATWNDAAVTAGKAWLAMWPSIALAAFITVLTRSSAAGIALSLGYSFLESITTAIMINLFSWYQTVSNFLLGRNITAWMMEGQDDMGGGAVLGGIVGEFPGELQAILVMAAYTLVLGGLAFWLLARRDIPATGGG
ncbi:MAG: ABC transporter permease [Chloroflexi bacterium]|nr:ABC transporter permease [Chloroflexota bacterium]